MNLILEILTGLLAMLGALVAFWSVRKTRNDFYKEYKKRKVDG